jgi:hypothetical protein
MSVIPILRRLRLEDLEIKISLGYIARFCPQTNRKPQ